MKKQCYILICILLQFRILSFGQYRHSYLQLGKMELWQENYVDAINFFSYYIKEHSNIYEGFYLRGLAKYYLTDLTGAEIDLTKAIYLLPEFPRLYLIRGVIRSENFKLPQALDDFDQAILMDSMYTDAYFYRSLSHLVLREYELALDDVNQVVLLDVKYPNAFILRGVIYSQLQDYDKAVLDFTECLTRNPENGRAFVERGSAYARLREANFAMADFDAALDLDSLNAYAYFQRGITKMEIMDFEGALADLNRVIEISPENELAYFNRAIINSNKSLDGEAIEDFLHILNQNPDNMLVYYNMGIVFMRLGHYDQADQSFSAAIDLFPDYADAYYQRALVRKEIGDIDKAKQDLLFYEKLNEINRNKDDSTKLEEGLEILRLSHLSNDFIREDEKKNKAQYIETEIELQPIFKAIVDSSFFLQKDRNQGKFKIEYKLKSNSLLSADQGYNKEFIQKQIDMIGNLTFPEEDNMNLYIRRGLLHDMSENYNEAISDLTKALSYDSRNVFVLFSRANARIGSLETLLNEQNWSSRISEQYDSRTLRAYSEILYDLHKVLEFDPDFLYARYNIGYTRFLMKDYSGALAEFTEVTLKKKIAEAHFNKALLQIFLDQKEEGCIELGIAGELGLKEAYSIIRKFCN
ncbi:MAG: tetratricopeptide repeat protein [Bacteroidales bacterium]|nr:tetratricopeptide repeat protein [Bacteroidales bacterium]